MTTIHVHEILVSVGFEKDDTITSDPPGGLSFDFGAFRLFASHCLGPNFRPAISFSGVLRTTRAITDVSFLIPDNVVSREQVIAMLAYYLDRQLPGELLIEGLAPWLQEGRENKQLLPWLLGKK